MLRITLLLGIALSACSLPGAEKARPNIIFIVADDLGYADLSCYGRKDYQTPALDRLAAQGVRFSQAYAGAPVCTPSRVSFITGRYPARLSVGLREPLVGSNADRAIGLPADHPTVSSLLKSSGYETALVGKWHLGSQPEHHPNRHGFEEFFGTTAGAADYINHTSGLGRPDLFHNEKPVQRDGYLTDLLTEYAVAFVSRPRERPFFLSLQYTAPHWPWQKPGDPPRPAAEAGSAAWTQGGSPETYASMMERLDAGIAAILAALDQHGIGENTLVIFTSDNGGEQFSRMAPLSGRKMQLREGGIRVPAIARWPGVLPAGRETDQVAITMDWTATILAAARVPTLANDHFDGIDLLPICRGEQPGQSRTLAWRTFQRTQHKALRQGDWKYFHDGQREYLFNLGLDPAEANDLKGEQPERFVALKKLYTEWEAQMLPPIALPDRPAAASPREAK
jgi:arylsulfatase A-like enzyme